MYFPYILSPFPKQNLKYIVLPYSVRPKPGFGIGNQNQGPISVFVSEQILFPETKTFFFTFKKKSCFPLLGGDVSFYKLKNKHRSSKMIWKYLKFGSKFGFRCIHIWRKMVLGYLKILNYTVWTRRDCRAVLYLVKLVFLSQSFKIK